MTVVIAVKDINGKPWIASDSNAYDNETYTEVGPKFIKLKNYIIGYTGSYMIANILNENISKLPKNIKNSKDMYKFCTILKKLLYSNGAKERHSEGFLYIADYAILLVITKDKIFEISGGFSFIEIKDITAIGAGKNFALGAYEALKGTTLSVQKRLRCALEATFKHSYLCGGEIYVDTIDN